LFGIKPNTPEAELIKAKEMAATLLHEAQRIQEEMEAKVNEARAQLDEAHHNHQAAMEIERAEKEALVAELQTARQDLEKLRTELQTALTPQVVKAFDNAVADAGATKELAAARILIEQQQRLIEKFQATPILDEEIKEALESLAKNFDDPARKIETKHTIYFLLNSVLGK
jgi:protein subunit release factor A